MPWTNRPTNITVDSRSHMYKQINKCEEQSKEEIFQTHYHPELYSGGMFHPWVDICKHTASTISSSSASWIIQVVFAAVMINQSGLSCRDPDSNKITPKAIYKCQECELLLQLYMQCIIKLSKLKKTRKQSSEKGSAHKVCVVSVVDVVVSSNVRPAQAFWENGYQHLVWYIKCYLTSQYKSVGQLNQSKHHSKSSG